MSVNCFISPLHSEAAAGAGVVAGGVVGAVGTPIGLAVGIAALAAIGGTLIYTVEECQDPNTDMYKYNSMYVDASGSWVESPYSGTKKDTLTNLLLTTYYTEDIATQGYLNYMLNNMENFYFPATDTLEIPADQITQAKLNGYSCGYYRYYDSSKKTYAINYGNSGVMNHSGVVGRFRFYSELSYESRTDTYSESNRFITHDLDYSYELFGIWEDYNDSTKTVNYTVPWAGTDILKVAGADIPVTYTPAGVSANLRDLIDSLQYPAIALNPAQALPYELSVPNVDVGELNNLKVSAGITSVFPFCLPFDFVRGLAMLSQKPTAPVFTIPFNIPSFGAFEGSENNIVLDMSKYDNAFYIVRWIEVALFAFLLIFISFKIVKGVR